MRIWTAHLHPARPPVLVPEGWSWGAAAFGPFWLLAHRAWVPGALVLAAVVILNLAVPGALRPVLVLGFFLLLGLLGRDLLRWALDRRGYAMQHVVAAPDGDAALLRLLDARGDLVSALAGGGARGNVSTVAPAAAFRTPPPTMPATLPPTMPSTMPATVAMPGSADAASTAPLPTAAASPAADPMSGPASQPSAGPPVPR